ncbi:type IV conjugative transfer system lipoprotein TraV [Xenorhabdus ishibashii]|uniref:Type IV conjugative transfer system protein TraV n=1 Tax=Xenorhabdus ishibashii TaxID=1034471 RepID=A0A2D0K852_9GAMM|nr:type IV conjugative transfer system lipoprotein TraV [Xenorhabdus ishibashii]PHM59555.1 hypothetical protein Xish_03674 [Xenorhabdus ishibashii]
MNKLLIAIIPVMLSGCAGMNSEFEFNKPAKDSGYWMQQADEMTDVTNSHFTSQSSVNNSGMGKFNLANYKLINITNITLPIKFVNETVNIFRPTLTPIKSNDKWIKSKPIALERTSTITPTTSTIEQTPTVTTISSVNNVANCTQKRCYQEAGEPFTTPARIQRVWLAPYVSPDSNVHVGEIVYFVSEESNWYGVK